MIYLILLYATTFYLAHIICKRLERTPLNDYLVEGTYSRSDGTTVYAWNVTTLLRASENIEVVDWEIPKDFLDDWYWEEEGIHDHLTRCLDADLQYPIIVDDRGFVLDGCHRTIKALSLGRSTMKAKILHCLPEPDETWEIEEKFNEESDKYPIRHRDMVAIVKRMLTEKD